MSRRSTSRRRQGGALSEINIVPYIDVMLVLLVIFMITTPLLSEGVNVKLPQAKAKVLKTQEAAPLIVSVDSKGLYYLNASATPQRPLDAGELGVQVAAQLRLAKQKQQHRNVFVKADQSVAYGQVMAAMVLLQQAGVDNVGLMTQDPHEQRET